MHRFSLRTQVFLLGGTFVAMLAAIAVTSWLVSNRLTESIYQSRLVVAQLKSLDDMKEDIEQGLADLLAYTGGDNAGLAGLRGNIEEVVAEVEAAKGRFVDVSIASARQPDVFKTVMTLTPTLDSFAATTAALERAAPEERRDLAYAEIVPAIALLRDTVNGLQDTMGERTQAVEAEITQLIERSRLLQLGISVAAMAGALIMALVFGVLLSRPIVEAARAVKRLMDEDYSSEIADTHRGDEVGEIARNLAGLRDRLAEAQVTEQKNQHENARRVELFQILSSSMARLKGGDMQQRIPSGDWVDLGESYEMLCIDFNDLASALGDLVEELRISAGAVDQNARSLSSMSDEMSQRAETQAATLEESAAALEQLSASVQSAAEQAQAADQQAKAGRTRAESGGQVMQEAKAAMSSIAETSESITKIITVIDDIAFQTSLLALNAGVEAARAGEAGRGFAVVASEVRGLAHLAAKSANDIKELVGSSAKQVAEGERLVEATGDTLSEIVKSVTEVSELVSSIASSATEQASGLQEINVGVAQLDQVTQQNAAMVHETIGASQKMQSESSRLTDLLQRFAGTSDAQQQAA
ncbi:chemotaxis protein [Phaeobacter gallaeciensis]|uniref:Chemotaxis protein n=1 Tax=Phaeobacter gallaeciensis TaxID=60890 RepID=A0A1B0ZVJ5_9RHOB|nr:MULTISPECIES: methyl-accepting chemotaxis protein [Phaeobacter]ANP38118.1 chemotaxis protein [Phaeobacter gallaeciensis]MEE2633378.1 methyl-accepting chemotaxis protein [Pseudomonadota bacterium]PVZ46171.1 methyl-accepting chemotaxis protein [Phaeobacter sp. JL2872]